MRKLKIMACVLAAGLALTGCSTSANQAEESKELKVLAYDSFSLDEKLLKKFEKDSGLKVKIISTDGGGELVNKLILTKDTPVADVVVGLDNSFAGRAIKEGVLESGDVKLPDGAEKFTAENKELVPVDYGEVCVNADKQWFEEHNLALPSTFEDLIKPEYKDLFAGINPNTSSAGLAFFLSSVAKFGETGWQDYWKSLKENGIKISKDWSGAYNVDFSAGEEKGNKPIVVSYATSPLESLDEATGQTRTVSLEATCYDQIEYASVVKGTKNAKGAKEFIEFLLSKDVQDTLLDTMYVFPVSSEAKIDEKVLKYTPPSKSALTISPDVLEENRDKWLKQWNTIVVE